MHVAFKDRDRSRVAILWCVLLKGDEVVVEIHLGPMYNRQLAFAHPGNVTANEERSEFRWQRITERRVLTICKKALPDGGLLHHSGSRESGSLLGEFAFERCGKRCA